MRVKVERHTRGTGHSYWFWCPGCKTNHAYDVGVQDRPNWTYNNDPVHPTFLPSLLVTWEFQEPKKAHRCHLYVRNGMIEYLGDCTHALAGSTIPMEDMEVPEDNHADP